MYTTGDLVLEILDKLATLCTPAALAAPERVRHHAGKHDQSGVAVRLEHRQAYVRNADIEPHDLPGEMRCESRKAEPEQRPGASERARKADEAGCEAVEHHKHRFGPIAEQERG